MRILIVTCRFGKNILGGAEKLAWEISHRLKDKFEIEVLTTCAKDYITWKNELPSGKNSIDDLVVHRFPVIRERKWERFGKFSGLVFRLNRHIGVPRFIQRAWLRSQGPYCPDLVGHLKDKSHKYERIIFIGYLYYPTVAGLPTVAENAVLISTAHDEPALSLKIFKPVFDLPRSMIFLSEEERDLVHSRFQNQGIPSQVAGVGVEDQKISKDAEDYFLYAGRIELGKNCPELFDFCLRSKINLKSIGSNQLDIPSHVEFLGYVGEKEKHRLISQSKAVIIPSKNESLSIVALEAWSHGKPVIVHSESPVLVGHVNKSEGGYIYDDALSFDRIVKNVDPTRGHKGWKYVRANYSWSTLITKFSEAMTW